VYANYKFTPAGQPISEAEWTKHVTDWLPTQADREYVRSCMVKVTERGKFANWIAPPAMGVNEKPIDFEYVKFH
jgi:benzoyl-CoA 2,3-dioxygenase component B